MLPPCNVPRRETMMRGCSNCNLDVHGRPRPYLAGWQLLPLFGSWWLDRAKGEGHLATQGHLWRGRPNVCSIRAQKIGLSSIYQGLHWGGANCSLAMGPPRSPKYGCGDQSVSVSASIAAFPAAFSGPHWTEQLVIFALTAQTAQKSQPLQLSCPVNHKCPAVSFLLITFE